MAIAASRRAAQANRAELPQHIGRGPCARATTLRALRRVQRPNAAAARVQRNAAAARKPRQRAAQRAAPRTKDKMDKFTHKMRPPLKKKAKVSVADLMRRGAEKKRPLGSNREETHLMGSLGASQLQRIDARIRKTKAKLSDEQLDVVAKAREGTSCFITAQRFQTGVLSSSKSSAACFARDTCDVCRGQSRSESKRRL